MQLNISTNYYTPQIMQKRNSANGVNFREVTITAQQINYDTVKAITKDINPVITTLKDGLYTITARIGDKETQIFTYDKADKLIKRQFYQYDAKNNLVEYMSSKSL